MYRIYFLDKFLPLRNRNFLTVLDVSIFLFLGLLLFPLVNLLPAGNELKFVLVPLVSILILIRTMDHAISFGFRDCFLFGFLTLCFLSVVDANNPALSWQHLSSWTSVLLLSILFRHYFNYVSHGTKFINLMVLMFCALFLLVAAVVMLSYVTSDGSWNKALGGNSNYITAYLITLFGALVFYKLDSKNWSLLKVLVGIGVLYLVLYTSLRSGVLVIATIVSILLIRRFYNRKLLLLMFFLSLIMLMSVLFYLIPEHLSSKISVLREINGQWKSGRYLFDQLSILLYMEHPFNGVGIGNWYTEVYKNLDATRFDLANIPPFNYPHGIYLRNPHNLYTRLLSEIGLIGLLFFITPILFCLRDFLRKVDKVNNETFSWYIILFIYSIFSIFLATANMSQYLFSELQLLGIMAYGLVPQPERFTVLRPAHSFISVILFLCILWSSFSLYANHQYYIAIGIENSGDLSSSIDLLDKINMPKLKEFVSDDIQFSHLLAKRSVHNGDVIKGREYFKHALNSNPYNSNVQLDYATFLFQHNININKADSIARVLLRKHGRNFDSYLLLAEIGIKEKKYDEAEEFLSKVMLSPHWPRYEFHLERLNDLKAELNNIKNR